MAIMNQDLPKISIQKNSPDGETSSTPNRRIMVLLIVSIGFIFVGLLVYLFVIQSELKLVSKKLSELQSQNNSLQNMNDDLKKFAGADFRPFSYDGFDQTTGELETITDEALKISFSIPSGYRTLRLPISSTNLYGEVYLARSFTPELEERITTILACKENLLSEPGLCHEGGGLTSISVTYGNDPSKNWMEEDPYCEKDEKEFTNVYSCLTQEINQTPTMLYSVLPKSASDSRTIDIKLSLYGGSIDDGSVVRTIVDSVRFD
jgi:hypothetical protein